MSAPDRRALVDCAAGQPSVRRQCVLLGVARFWGWRAPASIARHGLAAAAARRAVHGLAVPRLAADGGAVAGGRPKCRPQAGAAADAQDGDRRIRARQLLRQAPAERPGDLIHIDLADLTQPVVLNFMTGVPAERRAVAAENVLSAFKRVYKDFGTADGVYPALLDPLADGQRVDPRIGKISRSMPALTIFLRKRARPPRRCQFLHSAPGTKC